MALTTLFGTVQLELQNALAAQLRVEGGSPTVPNFVVISLRRESFQSQHGDAGQKGVEAFRRDLHEAVSSYLNANGWRVGGTGHLVINLLLRSIPRDCTVQVRRTDALYKLRIRDDDGIRSVGVRAREAKIGRAHDPRPRDFIAVNDRSRMISREHFLLRYSDLALTGILLGRNPTTLNDQPLGNDPFPLRRGDRLGCGTVVVEVEEV
jgi:hypothetical protein